MHVGGITEMLFEPTEGGAQFYESGLQWNPSIMDNLGTKILSVITTCPYLRGFW